MQTGVTDDRGNLEPPAGGDVVLSLPSPEALARQADDVRRVVRGAGTGTAPLVIVVESAEQLGDDELAPVIEASSGTDRPVILRIIRPA